MIKTSLTRREAFTALGATSALAALPGCTTTLAKAAGPATEAEASALLDSIAENLLWLSPESATSLGIDTGVRAALRSRLADRSQAGHDKLEATLRADLARAEAIDVSAVSHATRTSVEVVRSAYRTALEGFALPYGDVAVGGWRNTPYVVIQNVGAYLDTPRFLDSDHPVRTPPMPTPISPASNSYPLQLDGELGRIQAARGKGLVPPAFLIDKAITAAGGEPRGRARRRRAGRIHRTADQGHSQATGPRAARSIAGQRSPPRSNARSPSFSLQRSSATNDAGMWARPRRRRMLRAGRCKASTTTAMTPDEIHEMGLQHSTSCTPAWTRSCASSATPRARSASA